MLIHADLFDALPQLPADSIDACICDPPYGIGFMGREWDTFKPGEESNRILPNKEIDSDNPNLKGRQRAPASSPSAVEYDYSSKGLHGFQVWTEQWAREVLRVLKPGGYLLVCGAPRSFHRMTCGVEDAGFEIRDCLSWLYGSGFPKSLNISKAIDKAARGVPQGTTDDTSPNHGRYKGGRGMGAGPGQFMAQAGVQPVDRDLVDEALDWEGWGTALKPAWEPIVLARKPLEGTVVKNVLKYGTGGLDIEACRIDAVADRPLRVLDPKPTDSSVYEGRVAGDESFMGGSKAAGETSLGRWPANVLLDGDAAALLDEQSGESKETARVLTRNGDRQMDGWGLDAKSQGIVHGDSGGASRFFKVVYESDEIAILLSRARNILDAWKLSAANSAALNSRVENALESEAVASVLSDVVIVASLGAARLSDSSALSIGVTASELNRLSETLIMATLSLESESLRASLQDALIPNGCRAKIAEIQNRTGITTITISHWRSDGSAVNATFNITSISSEHGVKDCESRIRYVAKPSRAERDFGCEHLPARTGGEATDRQDGSAGVDNPRAGAGRTGGARNFHPTVKPVELMRWLVRLVTRPGATVLDPFTGSGTTGMACRYELREFIGIEREADYIKIAECRIAAAAPLFADFLNDKPVAPVVVQDDLFGDSAV